MNSNDKYKYISFYMPSNVYIPFDSFDKLTLRKNKVVYCGECLGTLNNGNSIYSPVSGFIKTATSINLEDTIVNSIIIENDFKDKRLRLKGGVKVFDNFKRKEANDILSFFNLSRKYNSKKNIIVDMSVYENDYENRFMALESSFELLETLDAILSIYSLHNCYIIVNDSIVDKSLKRYSRMYPNISFIRKNILLDDSVYYSGYEVLCMYYALKYSRKLNEKYITIVNKKDIIMVKTKINILVSEIIKSLKLEYSSLAIINYEKKKIDNYTGIVNENTKTILIQTN